MSIKTQLRSTADAFTNENHPARNYGDRPSLIVDASGGAVHNSYAEFSLKALPSDALVATALLRLHLRNDWPGTNTITAKRITTRWSETRISYDNVPTVSGVNTGTLVVTSGVEDDLIEVDVTDMIAQALAGANFHGIYLEVDTADSRHVHSREAANAGFRPRLYIEFGTTPTPPTSLHPRAGHACNAAKPVLGWDVDTQSASWVQVATTDAGFDPTTGFSSPEFDDGDWIVNTDQLYDLSTTAYGGVPDDDERFWTVAVKDEDGNESDFAEPVRFERHTYGSLAIDSPTTDVSTSTPTVLTTFTGRTLRRIDWTLRRLTDSGWKDVRSDTSDDDDFEITGVHRVGATYRLVVRAFDEFQRGNVPNEPAYVRADVEFTYVPGAPDPVTALVVTQADSFSPVLTAAWERASAPDSFGIYINDVLVETVESGDASIGGTSYEWAIWAAPPRTANDISVVATDAGEDSDPVTVTFTVDVVGVWILAPDADLVLPIFSIGPASPVHTSIGEDGETFFPLSGIPVRIVESVRGLEGSLSGDLIEVDSFSGITADVARARLVAIKELGVGASIRIAFGRRNFAAILGEFAVDEGVTLEETYRVTVPFWELTE